MSLGFFVLVWGLSKCLTNGSNGQIFAVTFFAKKCKKAAIKNLRG
jgi:hypothetical protein